MKTSDFDYVLPGELIAQTPAEPRDSSRLLVVERASGTIDERHFSDLPELLRPGDVLVCNDSRVLPARLFGIDAKGHHVEILLLRREGDGSWQALTKPGRHTRNGAVIDLLKGEAPAGITAEIISQETSGIRRLRFSDEAGLEPLGVVPLPPYIHQKLEQPERYQTVYSQSPGSVAAPTAGLHFTPQLLARLKAMGVQQVCLTLHIGLDTFRPVRVDDPRQHPVHTEFAEISAEAAGQLNQAKRAGGRILCVGTSSTRLVEFAAGRSAADSIEPCCGPVDLLILPGYRFRFTDGLLTNFHLPRSTTLMLATAFTGDKLLKQAYALAIEHRYRFYSFGDAMLIV